MMMIIVIMILIIIIVIIIDDEEPGFSLQFKSWLGRLLRRRSCGRFPLQKTRWKSCLLSCFILRIPNT